MFFCATCGKKIEKKEGERVSCFGLGNHIDPCAIPELDTKKDVRILLQDGVECFVYDARGARGDMTQICVPLETHPNVFRWNFPDPKLQPALFNL